MQWSEQFLELVGHRYLTRLLYTHCYLTWLLEASSENYIYTSRLSTFGTLVCQGKTLSFLEDGKNFVSLIGDLWGKSSLACAVLSSQHRHTCIYSGLVLHIPVYEDISGSRMRRVCGLGNRSRLLGAINPAELMVGFKTALLRNLCMSTK